MLNVTVEPPYKDISLHNDTLTQSRRKHSFEGNKKVIPFYSNTFSIMTLGVIIITPVPMGVMDYVLEVIGVMVKGCCMVLCVMDLWVSLSGSTV